MNAYQKHMEECKLCQGSPSELCPIGKSLLRAVQGEMMTPNPKVRVVYHVETHNHSSSWTVEHMLDQRANKDGWELVAVYPHRYNHWQVNFVFKEVRYE